MPLRSVLRALVGLIGLAAVFYLLAGIWTNFLDYRALATTDPSAAELYSDNCFVDAGLAAGVLIFILLFMVLLRQKQLRLSSGA